MYDKSLFCSEESLLLDQPSHAQYGGSKFCTDNNYLFLIYVHVLPSHTHTHTHHTQIFAATKDDRFYLIVTDYGSEDTNVEDLMSKSSFKK